MSEYLLATTAFHAACISMADYQKQQGTLEMQLQALLVLLSTLLQVSN